MAWRLLTTGGFVAASTLLTMCVVALTHPRLDRAVLHYPPPVVTTVRAPTPPEIHLGTTRGHEQ